MNGARNSSDTGCSMRGSRGLFPVRASPLRPSWGLGLRRQRKAVCALVAGVLAMRGLFSQVLTRDGSSGDPPARQEPDPDTADAMGCFASPKRLGHHGSISDVCVISYEPANGLMAVASRGGMVKVFGGPGVELVLEEEGTSIAGEDPPAHLLFPTSNILVGVTATGAVLSWDLAAGGRCGTIPSPVDPATGLEESVTSVHSATTSPAAAVASYASSEAQRDRYVFTGFESGRVRITQASPVCRASGYTVEPQETSSGAPEDLLAPGGDCDSGRSLGAVTSISSFGDRDGGGVGVFGHRYGGIVIWDWVRRKRLALRRLSSHRGSDEQSHGGGNEGEDDREVSSLAFHPSGQVFAAGFTLGCYAVFSTSLSSSSSSQDASSPRWVREVGDDGSCPREGPTIVRTGVSLVQWVSVRGAGAEGAWGLVVAGGVEMEEGEEPDGVSLLVPASSASAYSGSGGGGGRAKKKDIIGAAMAVLETAVFVPFAMGQERLSHVHCVVSGPETGLAATAAAGGLSEEAQLDAAGEETPVEQENTVGASEELVILGLVKWNEEGRGDDGRLHFRLASSILACPIQTSPYVALLQLSPEKFGPNVGGLAAVTAVASTPLLSSSTILDFMTCLGDHQQAEAGEGKTGGSPALSSLLRGGHLRWPDSVPPRARDDALCTSELLVAGHSDGLLTFWECFGPASRQDAVAISEGRVVMREVPSGALLLGSVPVAELAGKEDGAAGVTVSALDVWVERDYVAAAARNACWVAVGLDNGDATVIVLSNRMEASSSGSSGGFGSTGSGGDSGGGGKAESRGGAPLAEKPVEVSDVQLRDGTIEDSVGGGGGGGLLKRFVKRGGGKQQQSPGDEEAGVGEDAGLEAAIAEARAEARAIAAREGPTIEEPEKQGEPSAKGEADKEEERESAKQEREDFRQELLEAMAEEGTAGDSGVPPFPPRQPPPPTDTPEEGEARRAGEKKQPLCLDAPRKASLVQLSLRLHSLSVRCVALSFDSSASALALVVADEGGVVSVTDISTGSASLLPMRVPQSRPCRPSVAIGPLPGALSSGRVPALGASGALFVLLEGWLNVFDFASRDPVDFVQVPGLAPQDSEGGDGGGGGGGTDDFLARSRGRTSRRDEGEEKSWLACVDERGLPLLPYASESFCSSYSPPPVADKGEDGGGGGGGCDDGGASEGRGEIDRDALSSVQTIWVTPPASRTALDDSHEYELQVLNNSPPPEPFLLVVRGAMAVVLAIARRDPESVSSSVFSRRSSSQPSATNAAAFKGRSGAELVVKSRGTLPRAEGHAAPPRVYGAGVCLVPAGKGPEGGVARRGCLVAADSSGFVTGLLLPSLCPIFRDRLPAGGDVRRGGARALAQESMCNLVGELTHLGMAGELTRWSLLTDEACDTLTGSRARLVKVSALARPPAMSRQSSGGGSGGSTGAAAPKGRSARGMLGRLSLGGSKKSVADVFAVEPSPRRQPVSRESSVGGGGFGSTRSSFSSSAGGAGSMRVAASRGAASAQAQAQDQREALFGERQAGAGATAARDGAVAGGGGARGGVSGTHAAVSEARDLAIERGEKLENLVDRSRQLEDSAMAFGDMAKQLRRQQEDESCCVS